MKWPWKRHHSGVAEARAARETAERELARIKAETPFYEAVGDRMKTWREENHFAARIDLIFGGKQ